MEQDYQTILVSWTAKTSRDGTKQYWEMTFQGGQILAPIKASAWEQGIAQKAMNLLAANPTGVPVVARLEQNGKYWNVREIGPQGEQLPPLQAQAGTLVQPTLGQPQMQPTSIGAPINPNARQDEINERIARQEAQRTAAIMLSGQLTTLEELEGFEELHRELAMRLYLDADPRVGPKQRLEDTIVPTATTPAEIAAQVPGVQVGVETPEAPAAEETPSWA